MRSGEALGLPPVCEFAFRIKACDKPGAHDGPDHECQWTVCRERGEHECVPRWHRFYLFAGEMLTHVKGSMKGRPLWFDQWQIDDLIRPIFGKVHWSDDFQQYVRRYTMVWIETARKTGKSHFLAAVLLYIMVAEKEEAAEIYGAARTKDQAKIVYTVAKLMIKKNPRLWDERGGILKLIDYQKRIVFPATESFYACISADDDAALGQDPSALICDEIVAWRDRTMWDSVRTGMGSAARAQPLMIAATTPGTNLASFAKRMHDQMLRILLKPERSPHTYVLLRNAPRSDSELEELCTAYAGHPDLPVSIDVFDERNWTWPQPGLGKSVTVSSMREQAADAKDDPEAENAFRTFKMAQWTSQLFRWMPMHKWDSSGGEVWESYDRSNELEGKTAYAGLDLSSRSDLTAWCLLIPDDEGEHFHAVWRFWITEEALKFLDREHNGDFSKYARAGWLHVSDGVVIDYEKVYADIAEDAQRFQIVGMDADEWSFMPVIQRIHNDLHLSEEEVHQYKNTFERMSPGMDSVKILVKQGKLWHHHNPLARFCFECVEVRRAPYNMDLIRPEKPQKDKDPTRIDAVPTLVMAENCRARIVNDDPGTSAYADHDPVVV